ncbi:MAG: uncharacterized protein QG641_2160 [Candidatus Poribacteria bacterium]|nr:uncharacterized protein [Candidatus Poribacteria bacterium]
MKALSEISDILKQHKKEFEDKYKVKEIGIFGSYSKGQQKKTSDLVIVVDFDEVPDLFTFLEFESYVEKLIKVRTDMVRKNVLRPELKDKILDEVVYL